MISAENCAYADLERVLLVVDADVVAVALNLFDVLHDLPNDLGQPGGWVVEPSGVVIVEQRLCERSLNLDDLQVVVGGPTQHVVESLVTRPSSPLQKLAVLRSE